MSTTRALSLIALVVLAGCATTTASPAGSPSAPMTSPVATSAASTASGAATTAPASVLAANDRLTTAGIGAIQIGASVTALEALGAAAPADTCENAVGPSKALAAEGVSFHVDYETKRVSQVELTTPKRSTLDGARVGMLVSQVKALYGTKVAVATVSVMQNQRQQLVMRADGAMIVFLTDAPVSDSTSVVTIVLKADNGSAVVTQDC